MEMHISCQYPRNNFYAPFDRCPSNDDQIRISKARMMELPRDEKVASLFSRFAVAYNAL